MATVNTKNKWEWVLTLEYAYITTIEYIKLGSSLSGVQIQSLLRGTKLTFRDAKQRLLPWTAWNHTLKTDTADTLLRHLLTEVNAMAHVTHGQSVGLLLMRAFTRQAALLSGSPLAHQTVFEMVESDAAAEDMRRRGVPLRVTYTEAVKLTELLSEALAWEWFLCCAKPNSTRCPAIQAARKDTNKHVTDEGSARHDAKGEIPVVPHTLALLLHNSAEFNLLWMAASHAGTWLTFLHALYRDMEVSESFPAYHHCSTALLNTNLTNHSTLCHALECASAEFVLLEASFIPLLFASAGEGRDVDVPHCVRRIFVWRGGTDSTPAWMIAAINRFNAEGRKENNGGPVAGGVGEPGQERHVIPSLDLFDLVCHPCSKTLLSPQELLAERICNHPPPTRSNITLQEIRHTTKRLLLRFRPVMPVLYIYTSGTTGLPKAAKFSHLRFFAATFLSAVMPMRRKLYSTLAEKYQQERKQGIQQDPQRSSFADDLNMLTVYNCLPMYHTVGCVFCIGHLLRCLEEQQKAARCFRLWIGRKMSRLCDDSSVNLCEALPPTARMVIRSKFSASRFVRDLQLYRVTVFQYIGEILRYAMHHEKMRRTNYNGGESLSSMDTVRGIPSLGLDDWIVPFAFGNGLRADIWNECKSSLHIAQIVEFYSSTEGNVFLMNLFDIPGVVGHLPLFPGPLRPLSTHFNPLFPFRVLRYDCVREGVWRDTSNGRCAFCQVGETGEIVGEIIQGLDIFGLRRFDGYHSMAETNKKILRHALKSHDAFFLSGDLVRFDRMGFVSFVDRVGETFRWKGENVSTMEVMNALNTLTGRAVAVLESIVYGIHIPGREGRAGMAKLVLCDTQRQLRHPPSLPEEEAFMRDELHQLLRKALPPYAIPVCVRMDDPSGEETHTERETIDGSPHQGSSPPKHSEDGEAAFRPVNAAADFKDDETTRTSTFKYRRHVLSRDGYRFALSASCHSRVYVLAAQTLEESSKWGYVPFNTKTVIALGEELQNCGW